MSNETPPQASPSKTMSSRLMTMKFMQRAAASSPSVPQPQARSSDVPPSKRQKVSVAPSSTATSRSDLQLIQIALAEEERKRGNAIERLAEEAGETNWTLSTVNGEGGHGVGVLRVAKAGYTDIDQEARRPVTLGRRSFGKFNRDLESTDFLRAQKCQFGAANKPPSSGEIDSAASEEDREEGDDPAGTGEMYCASREETIRRISDERNQRKQRRRAQEAELARLAEERGSKEVKLNNLSSISGAGVGGNKLDMECYSCGERGHAKRQCPRRGKRKNDDGRSGAAKKTKSSLDD